jgi:hypothetical protein
MARRCLILSALFGESFGAVMSFLSNLPGVRFELGRDPGRYHERTRRFGTPRWRLVHRSGWPRASVGRLTAEPLATATAACLKECPRILRGQIREALKPKVWRDAQVDASGEADSSRLT